MSQKYLVLWDGDCRFCSKGIDWVRRMDQVGALDLQPYQGVSSPIMTPEFSADCARAIQVVLHDGSILSAGRAVLFMWSVLGWKRTSRFFSLPPMIWLIEIAYSFVASHRSFFSRILFRAGS